MSQQQQQHSSQFKGLSLDEVFSDLASRFVVNMPADELTSIERICFQVEQCHWFYEDFVQPQRPDLPVLNLRRFSELFLIQCSPHLSAFSFNPKAAYDAFLRYKSAIPVRGAVLVNPTWDKVVLVKGWKSSAGWGFPKGKINKNESDRDCAVREVWEEIGYDISPHFASGRKPYTDQNGVPAPLEDAVDVEDDYLDISIQDQNLRIFVVPNVQEDAVFVTRTRKEISKIAWFSLKELPGWSKKANASPVTAVTCFNAHGAAETVSTSRFYLVMPVVRSLKSWISKHKSRPKPVQEAPPPIQATAEAPDFENLNQANAALQAFFLTPQTNHTQPNPIETPNPMEEDISPEHVEDRSPLSTPEDRNSMRKKLLLDLDALAAPNSSTQYKAPFVAQQPPPNMNQNGLQMLFPSAAHAHSQPPSMVPQFIPQPPPASMAYGAMQARQPYIQVPPPFLPITISQPTPIRPIPLLSLQSPQPPPTRLPPQQQSAALLGLLNIKPAL